MPYRSEILEWFDFVALTRISAAAVIALVLALAAARFPRLGASVLARMQALSRRVRLWIAITAIFPVAIRLAVLPWSPPAIPYIHDDFGHLLVADTLLHGRLANPPHPMRTHLETFYVLQWPAYASVYPIGNGLALAAGKLAAGDVWYGLLIGAALMCGALTWFYYGCLPPFWAMIAGVVSASTVGTLWLDMFRGGSVCGFGGALLLGSLIRLRERTSVGLAMAAGLGWSLMFLTRPFESVVFLLLMAVGYTVVIFRTLSRGRRIAITLGWALFPALTGALTVAHNRSVTGDALLLPYQYEQKVAGVPQGFVFQPVVAAPTQLPPVQRSMYEYQLKVRTSMGWSSPLMVADKLLGSFTPNILLLPLLAGVVFHRDGRRLALFLIAGILFSSLYPFRLAQYYSGYAGVCGILVAFGLMRISSWRVAEMETGKWLAIFLVIAAVLHGSRVAPLREILHNRSSAPTRPMQARADLVGRLERAGGKHLLFVREGPNHSFPNRWVFNGADIDNEKIVWCNYMGAEADREAVRYFRDRAAWIVYEDGPDRPVQVSRYNP